MRLYSCGFTPRLVVHQTLGVAPARSIVLYHTLGVTSTGNRISIMDVLYARACYNIMILYSYSGKAGGKVYILTFSIIMLNTNTRHVDNHHHTSAGAVALIVYYYAKSTSIFFAYQLGIS